MCLADAAQARFYYSTNNAHRHQQSRPTTTAAPCAADTLFRDMRFPRLTTARTAIDNGGALDRPAAETEATTATKNATRTTPIANATTAYATPNANATATTTTLLLPRAAPSDAALRRCQSARPHVSSELDCRDHRAVGSSSMHRTRSHSQKTPRGCGAGSRSRELPIPPMRSSYSDSGVLRSSPPRRGHAEESDLARMYDYATWNMYERIVSARRRRLALIDQQVRRDEEEKEEERRKAIVVVVAADSSRVPSAAAGPVKWDAVVVPAPERDEPRARERPTPQAALHKNSSNDENSTLATADETDRASTTSSWSRADSPLYPEHRQRQRRGTESATAGSPGLPSLRRLGFSSSSKNDEGRREMTTNSNNNEDDAFIFELDM